MNRICDLEAAPTLNRAYGLLWTALQTSHRNSAVLKAVFEVPSSALLTWAETNHVRLPRTDFVWTANWLQSLTHLLAQLNVYDSSVYAPKVAP